MNTFDRHLLREWLQILGLVLAATCGLLLVRVLYEDFRDLDRPPLVVVDGGERTVGSREELLQHFLAEGKKGLSIQRYTGLGEMNAEQLWESTMEPATRTLLQVRLEDDEVAEYFFTSLMGDAVEARLQFIEDIALNVRFLYV